MRRLANLLQRFVVLETATADCLPLGGGAKDWKIRKVAGIGILMGKSSHFKALGTW